MELKLVRTFVTVARAGTFGAAATELAVSQPALTKQMQVLERRVGVQLFVRGRQGARLTTAGRALLPDAVELLDRAAAFERRAVSVAAGDDGALTVGFGLAGVELAPQVVAAFRAAHPTVSVALEDLPSAVQCERLLAGSLQVGFVRLPVVSGVQQVRLRKDRLTLALPAGASTPSPIARWLDRRPLIRVRPDRSTGLTAQIERLYAELGCRPQVQQEADDLRTALALVAAGDGAAVVPASTGSTAPPGVRLVPLRGRAASWWIGAAWVERSTPIERFLTVATDVARN